MSLRTLLFSAELSSASGIYALLNRVNNDDKTLYCMLRMLMMKGGITRDVAKEALESICYFYTDSSNKFMASLARSAVEKIEGVKVATPKGAFYCIAKLPVKNADDFAQWLLESYDNNGETVMVAPAAGFYSTPNVGLDEVRIAYVLKKEDLIKSVRILKNALDEYKK